MSKRHLTDDEINNIIEDIVLIGKFPEETKKSIEIKIRNDIKNHLKQVKIYPSIISKLKDQIIKQYHKTIAHPGESVGVLTAQSIGERQTQMTLNTFHSAGLAVKTVITGVPRFSELLNATKDPKSVACDVYFKEYNKDVKKLRDYINNQIVENKLKNLIKSVKFGIDEKKWYDTFSIIYENVNFEHLTDCIQLKLNKELLYEYKIDTFFIAKKIETEYEDLICVFSSNDIAEIDVYVNTTNISLPEDRLLFITKDNCKQIYLEEVVLPNLENILLCGIEGIKSIFYKRNDNDEWLIETEGCNFSKLLSHPIVDSFRIRSNNMWDIYHTLGIEAAREFLIDEFISVVSSDGTFINERHVMLLVDVMTFSGTITSVSRYGLKNENVGPLKPASFEESLEHFLNAGIFAKIDNITGVSASITCGKRSNIGTGICNVFIDVEQLPCEIPLLNSIVKENI
jgi:DNA-directed RNA polymerase beta' subunit